MDLDSKAVIFDQSPFTNISKIALGDKGWNIGRTRDKGGLTNPTVAEDFRTLSFW